MSPQDFLASFHEIANAPGGVGRLRSVVLQLAITGHLADKNETEGTAKSLNDTIQEARTAFAKSEGSKLATVTKTTPPAELEAAPAHWEWRKLGELTTKIGSGSTPRGGSKVYVSKGIPFLRSQNVWNEGLRMDDVVYIPDNVHRAMRGTHVQANDMLLNITGASLGRCSLVPDSLGPANVSQHVTIIRCAVPDIRQFVRLCLLSPFGQAMIWGRQVGMAREGLSKKVLEQFEIPLPPLAEQKRIVAKVEELMALCDALAAQQQERDRLFPRLSRATHTRLTDSPTQPHLDSLFTDLGSISPEDMRKTVLQLAIRGMLVEQEPNDESAALLIKRLKAVTKDPSGRRRIGTTTLAEPFLLPQGWCWTSISELALRVTSGSRDWAAHYSDSGAKFVRMGNLSRGSYHMRLNSIQRITPPADTGGARTRLEANDILVSITGEVGLLGLVPPGFGEAYINQHTCLIRLPEELHNRYLAEFMRSPFAQAQFNEPQRGLKNSFRLSDVSNLLIPLPPLAEQRRIVAKVDELMALVDTLEAQQQEKSRLAEAFAQVTASTLTAQASSPTS